MTKLLILLLIIAVFVVWLKFRQHTDRQALLAKPLDPAVLTTVLTLLAGGGKLRAIGMLRGTGIGMAGARMLVEAIQQGHRPPMQDEAVHLDEQRLPDLASRARALHKDGWEQDAVSLVCDETGMNSSDATRFVRNLR